MKFKIAIDIKKIQTNLVFFFLITDGKAICPDHDIMIFKIVINDGDKFHGRIQRSGTGGPDPPEKSQKYRFPSNVDLDPLKFTKPPS